MLVQLNEELHLPTDLSLPRSPGRLQFYLKRKTIQPRSSLFMLPDKGLQRSLEMFDCVTDYSRSTFQQPWWLLEPPPALYATNQALCSKYCSFSQISKALCQAWEKDTTCASRFIQLSKDLRGDLNFIFF